VPASHLVDRSDYVLIQGPLMPARFRLPDGRPGLVSITDHRGKETEYKLEYICHRGEYRNFVLDGYKLQGEGGTPRIIPVDCSSCSCEASRFRKICKHRSAIALFKHQCLIV